MANYPVFQHFHHLDVLSPVRCKVIKKYIVISFLCHFSMILVFYCFIRSLFFFVCIKTHTHTKLKSFILFPSFADTDHVLSYYLIIFSSKCNLIYKINKTLPASFSSLCFYRFSFQNSKTLKQNICFSFYHFFAFVPNKAISTQN